MDREVHQGHWKQVSQAYFIMVAKFMAEAHKGDKPHLIPLIADSPEEKAILAKGSRRSEQRRERREASLKVKPPTASEIAQLHQLLYMNAGPRYTESCRKVSDTVLEATKLCHPQERNLNEKIFGGYLMREAFELAFTNCLLHFRGPLECVAIDDIVFLYPVSIGDILRLSATIVYSDGRRRLLQVQVDADVIDPRDGSQLRTNTFHFTFTPRDDVQPWRDVHPETYAEAIEWLQAQRRLVSVE
jgi:acyl-coenzyme A thioesterase 9